MERIKVDDNNKIYELITKRHSCRKFLSKEVSDENIEKILECGLLAPSAMNKQPWFFVVIKNKRKISIDYLK